MSALRVTARPANRDETGGSVWGVKLHRLLAFSEYSTYTGYITLLHWYNHPTTCSGHPPTVCC